MTSLALAAAALASAASAVRGRPALAAAALAAMPALGSPGAEARCKSGTLALTQLGTTNASGIATTTFGVSDLGAPCTLPRFAIVRAFDANGDYVLLSTDKVRELDIILTVHLRAGAIARFTIVSASMGSTCRTVASVIYVVDGNRVEAPASFPACTGPGVAGPHVSFLMAPPFSVPPMPRKPPGAGASNPLPPP